jgi:apolipoprotein N-acyltransferase
VVRETLRAVPPLGRGVRPRALPLAAIAALFASLLGATLLYGGQRQISRAAAEAPASGDGLDVVVVQGNVGSSLRWKRTQASRVLRRYARLTREALRGGGRTDLVVWPEQALQTSPDDGMYGPPLRSFIDGLGTPVLLGAPRHAGAGSTARVYNTAFLMQPGGETIHYDKLRLLPFSEVRPMRLGRARGDLGVAQYAAGDRPGVLMWEGPTLGLLICFEAVYPEMARSLAQRGARVLVNIANDSWFRGRGGQEQHLAQVVFRAIETGLPMVRASTTGISAIVGPDGSVWEQLDPNRAGALSSTLPTPRHPPPLYLRIGDVFALACAGIVGAALALGLRRRLRWRSLSPSRPDSASAHPTP